MPDLWGEKLVAVDLKSCEEGERETRNTKEGASQREGHRLTGILPSFHDGRLWKEGLGVEFASVLFGNLGKSEKLCVCVGILMLYLAQGQMLTWWKMPGWVLCGQMGGVRKLLHLGTVIYCWMTLSKLLNLSGPQLLTYQVREPSSYKIL